MYVQMCGTFLQLVQPIARTCGPCAGGGCLRMELFLSMCDMMLCFGSRGKMMSITQQCL